jgi:hypothetical protein
MGQIDHEDYVKLGDYVHGKDFQSFKVDVKKALALLE